MLLLIHKINQAYQVNLRPIGIIQPNKRNLYLFWLTPQPIMRPFIVPLRRRGKKDGRGGVKVGAEQVVVDAAKPQTRRFRHLHKAVLNERVRHSFNLFIPPGFVYGMVFQHQKVFCGGGAVDVCQEGDGGTGVVHRHCYAMLLRQIANLFGLHDAAGGG